MPLSTFLNNRPPTQLRGLTWLALSDTAVIQVDTVTSDTGGGASQSWAASGTLPCRIAPLTNRPLSRMVGGQIDERSTHVVTVPPGTVGVDLSDRVAIVGRGTFEVTGVRERTDALTGVFEVMQVS